MSNTTIPFTYILKFNPTNQYYYGVKWAKGCNPSDLWVTYFSSSSHINKLITDFGKDSFEFRVSKIFQTKEEATSHERRFLLRVNAAHNGKFINKRNNMPEFSPAGLIIIHHPIHNFETWHDPTLPIPEGWVVGVTESHRKANSACRKGKPTWNKDKHLPPTGPCTLTRKQNISKSRLLTKKILCIHCNKEFDPGNYTLYHGDNCKLNPLIDHKILTDRSERCRKSTLKSIEDGTHFNPNPNSYGILICPYCNVEGTNMPNMKKNHFDRCKHNPDSEYYNKKRATTMRRISCINCHKETDSGNFVLHHGIMCKRPIFSDILVPTLSQFESEFV